MKMVFIALDIFRIVLKGSIIGGAYYNHLDPYLNITTVPFDIYTLLLH